MSERPHILSREDIAKREIGHTAISRSAKWALVLVLLGTLAAPAAVQQAAAVRGYWAGRRTSPWPASYGIFPNVGRAVRAGWDQGGPWPRRLWRANGLLKAELKRYEDALGEESVVSMRLRGPTQYALARLGAGNEQAYVGRDGWLFYRPGVDYVVGPSFLHPRQLAGRAERADEWTPPAQPDPRPAILDFHRQLADHGIALVLMPTPVKPMIQPSELGGRCLPGQLVRNPAWERFRREMEQAGVLVFDPAPDLARWYRGLGIPPFLRTDTHWQPEAMQLTAAGLAEFLQAELDLPAGPVTTYLPREESVTAVGDIARMLQLPAGQDLFPPETVTVRAIRTPAGEPWRPDRNAPVLVLGDSFANVYSLGEMGWGESAGLVEQLSYALGRPVDRIVRNAGGAYATREELIAQLSAEPGRLDAVRVVVWQFAERELAVGDWKRLSLPAPGAARPSRPSDYFVPAAGQMVEVTATVADASTVPRPGATAYKDHIFAIALTDVRGVDRPIGAAQAVVYAWSMRDNVLTDAARLSAGDRLRLRLRPWADVADRYEPFSRSMLDDLPAGFDAFCWGEDITKQ